MLNALESETLQRASAPRRLASHEDYQACVQAQRLVWGEDYDDVVPASLLKVSQRVGALIAGVFGSAGEMLGFVYSLPGFTDGKLVHWSHMLGVRPEARNRGIGRRLKEFQRAELRRSGVEQLYWTFDPLVSRNAHLNLNKLGVNVVEYVADMYAAPPRSGHNIPMDRLVVCWKTNPETPEVRKVARFGDAPLANACGQENKLPLESCVRIEIPANLDTLTLQGSSDALFWRTQTRGVFQHYLSRGYAVVGFQRGEDRSFYLLQRRS